VAEQNDATAHLGGSGSPWSLHWMVVQNRTSQHCRCQFSRPHKVAKNGTNLGHSDPRDPL